MMTTKTAANDNATPTLTEADLDRITQSLTCSPTFLALIKASYTPTIRPISRDARELADAYDWIHARLGTGKRCFRG